MYLASCAVPQVALADCAHEIIDQAYKGSVTRHYSQACYSAAIRIEPVDGSSYSDIDAIIKDAKQRTRCASRPRRPGPAPRAPDADRTPALRGPARLLQPLAGDARHDAASAIAPLSGDVGRR